MKVKDNLSLTSKHFVCIILQRFMCSIMWEFYMIVIWNFAQMTPLKN